MTPPKVCLAASQSTSNIEASPPGRWLNYHESGAMAARPLVGRMTMPTEARCRAPTRDNCAKFEPSPINERGDEMYSLPRVPLLESEAQEVQSARQRRHTNFDSSLRTQPASRTEHGPSGKHLWATATASPELIAAMSHGRIGFQLGVLLVRPHITVTSERLWLPSWIKRSLRHPDHDLEVRISRFRKRNRGRLQNY
jgi:hypothetical protein